MNPPKKIHILSISIGTATVFGAVFHRLWSDWGALVRDVGDGGAWVVSIFYYAMYGCIISIGALLSAATLKKFDRTLSHISIGIAALLCIAIMEVYLKINMPKENIFWEIVAILISCGWIINSAIAPDIWMHNQKNAPDQKAVR